jgi:RNA polymerase sigma-70 factor (ECF subfamily)
VDRSEVACRQIASRARRRLRDAPTRRPRPAERRVVDELVFAIAAGDVEGALARVAPDVVLISDGGATRRAARQPVVGAHRVVRWMTNLSRRELGRATVTAATVNGDPGLVIRVGDEIDLVAAFEVQDERVAAVWIVRNPEKLEHVDERIMLA